MLALYKELQAPFRSYSSEAYFARTAQEHGPGVLHYALPLTQTLTCACAGGIPGVIARELLYREIQQSLGRAGCRPVRGMTPKSILVSPHNEQERESPSNSVFRKTRLVEPGAEYPGNE